jgi:hypothetical protein
MKSLIMEPRCTIGLSSKFVKLRESKAEVDDDAKKATSISKSTLGDLFGDQFKKQ